MSRLNVFSSEELRGLRVHFIEAKHDDVNFTDKVEAVEAALLNLIRSLEKEGR